jgi:hypothetical protein
VRVTIRPCKDKLCPGKYDSGKYDYSYSYLEAWPAMAGLGSKSDNAKFHIPDNTQGSYVQITEIIFVPKSDKINLETDPAWGKGKVHGPSDNEPAQTGSGPALATDDNYKPSWWKPSATGRYFSVNWKCCDGEHFVDTSALPNNDS